MNILQIVPELNIGGVERGCVDLARELVLRKHRAIVISNGGKLVAELEKAGARHYCLAVHQKSLFSILRAIPKVAKILVEEKIDLVHARSRVPALIAFWASRQAGVHFVTTCHGHYSNSFFSRVMGWGKLVIVSSNVIARHMQEQFGVPPERLRFIPRGVDLEQFIFRPKAITPGKDRDEFTIGLISRLTPIKGHTHFLQAIARVIRVIPKVKVLIVGEASPGKEQYKEELKMLTRRLGLSPYVKFSGQLDNIPAVLSGLDLLVLPTLTQEAFGRVLIEAGACGVPVIATQVGGIVDIVEDGVNGKLVPPGNSEELAKAIIALYKAPELRQRFAFTARKNVEQKFSLKLMADKTIAVYEEVLACPRILVIKLSALGDVILAIPSLRALREKFPQGYIAVAVNKAYAQVLRGCPYINEVLEFSPQKTAFRDLLRFSQRLRQKYFDFAFDLQNNRRSHLLAYLSGAPKRYGYHNGKFSFLLNEKVRPLKSALAPVAHQARTLALLGITKVEEDLALWPDKEDQAWADYFLEKAKINRDRPLIGINLGSSVKWPTKRWALENYALLIKKLRSGPVEILITGQGSDEKLAKRLESLVAQPIIQATGETSVRQLISLVKHCSVYITGDSAPLHIAYAMKIPVVALFGPTSPERHALVQAKQVIIHKELPCAPCYKRRCKTNQCMQEITPEEVYRAVMHLLEQKARSTVNRKP